MSCVKERERERERERDCAWSSLERSHWLAR